MDPATLAVVLVISWGIMRGARAAGDDSRNYRSTAERDLRRDQPGHSDRWYRRHAGWRWLGRMAHEIANGLPTLAGHIREDTAYAQLGYAQARAGHHVRLRDLRRLLAEAREKADQARAQAEREDREREAAQTAAPAGRHAVPAGRHAAPRGAGGSQGPADEAPAPLAPPQDPAGDEAGRTPETDGSHAEASADEKPAGAPAAPAPPPASQPRAEAESAGGSRDTTNDTDGAGPPLEHECPADAGPGREGNERRRDEERAAPAAAPAAGVVDPFGQPGRVVAAGEIRTIGDLRDFMGTRSAAAAGAAQQMEDAQAVVATTAHMNDPVITGPLGRAATAGQELAAALATVLAGVRTHEQGESYVAEKGTEAAADTEFLAADTA
jgi:hypothetical protein